MRRHELCGTLSRVRVHNCDYFNMPFDYYYYYYYHYHHHHRHQYIRCYLHKLKPKLP
jgi:hypothetical protein